MISRWFLVLAGSLIISQGCKKQSDSRALPRPDEAEPMWHSFSVANSSLPNDQVNAIVIDNHDVKWIGTAGGLVRISGESWTVYSHENSPLPSSFIQALTVTEDGTVWVGTNKGLASFNDAEWSIFNTGNSVLRNNGIMSLTYDKKRKITWIGTAAGLVEVNKNGGWKLFDEIEGDLILSMAADQGGVLWLGTFNPFSFRGRIKKLENENWRTWQLDQLGYASSFPYGVTVDEKNRALAVLSGTSVKSVIRKNGDQWEEMNGPSTATGLKTLLTEGEKIWAGGNGLAEFGNEHPTTISIPESPSLILAIANDRKNKKWLGTIDKGIVIYHAGGN